MLCANRRASFSSSPKPNVNANITSFMDCLASACLGLDIVGYHLVENVQWYGATTEQEIVEFFKLKLTSQFVHRSLSSLQYFGIPDVIWCGLSCKCYFRTSFRFFY